MEDWFQNLPRTSFSTLPDLYRRIWSCTSPQPRETNSAGRYFVKRTRTTVTTEEVCDQHRYETLVIPLACQYSWPCELDFAIIAERVKMDAILVSVAEIYLNPRTCILFETFNQDSWRDTNVVQDIIQMSQTVREAPKACG